MPFVKKGLPGIREVFQIAAGQGSHQLVSNHSLARRVFP
jgi:hypothetical protein